MTVRELEEITMSRIYFDTIRYCGDDEVESGFIDEMDEQGQALCDYWEVSQIYAENGEYDKGSYLYIR